MKLLVIDGNSIMNRAFYGIRTLTNSQGVNTNALYGFLTTLHRHLKEEEECRVAAAFDLKAPTYRHEMFKDYKAGRKRIATTFCGFENRYPLFNLIGITFYFYVY